MTQTMKVKRGAEYLPEYKADLEQLHQRLPRDKPRPRVLAYGRRARAARR